ncbi:MAG TPA: radical SAM protein [Allosphingosinicella sp.]
MMHAPADEAEPLRKAVPWLFYGQTTSLCETCWELVPAKIIGEEGRVYLQKRCREHGVMKTLIEEDADYWLSTKQWLKPGDRPLFNASRTERGCPWDCGLCPDHEQHSCLAIVEINDACNLTCPVCFADSAVGKGGHRPLAEVEAMLDAVVKAEGEPDLVQLSGGEPTIHPQFWEILAAARARPIRHLMINTNGVRIATEVGFADRLAALGPGFEVYLQFDSLSDEALMSLRGARLGRIRRQALERLDAAGVSTTLVCAVRQGVNDHEAAAIVEHALGWTCVRGVVFQPVQDAGRNEGFDPALHRTTLSGLRRRIAEGGRFGLSDLVPLPCNPDQICIGYGIRAGADVIPVTRLMPREEIVAAAPNTISFERDPALKKRIFDLLSLSTNEANGEDRLSSLFCCLPGIEAPASLSYKDTFKVAIIQFLDRYNFDIGTVKRSCIHFATPDGRMIPFDTYNSFYRPGAPGRAKLESMGGVGA